MVRCPYCNNDNPDWANFCNLCGKPLSLLCSYCQKYSPIHAKFCNHCGQPIKKEIDIVEMADPSLPGKISTTRKQAWRNHLLSFQGYAALIQQCWGSISANMANHSVNYREDEKKYAIAIPILNKEWAVQVPNNVKSGVICCFSTRMIFYNFDIGTHFSYEYLNFDRIQLDNSTITIRFKKDRDLVLNFVLPTSSSQFATDLKLSLAYSAITSLSKNPGDKVISYLVMKDILNRRAMSNARIVDERPEFMESIFTFFVEAMNGQEGVSN